MKPEKQRIAIAEACGWSDVGFYEDNYGLGFWSGIRSLSDKEKRMLPKHKQESITKYGVEIPNYLNDLNAMHLVEQTLDTKQQVWYLQKLSQVRLKQGEGGMIACLIDRLAFATAPQRAEAFLRTIGKWEDK